MLGSKIFTVFAGINGAGKSTLYQTYSNLNFGFRLNTDELVRESGADWRDVKAQIEAGKKLLKLQSDYFSKGLSCNRETTLTGHNIIDSIKTAKSLGYQINLWYVGVCCSEIAKERIAKRVAEGGHGVSENTVDRRFEGSKENFYKVLPLCDNINIFDNSVDSLRLVAFLKNGVIKRTEVPCEWCDELLKYI